MDQLLTPKQVADRLQVHPESVIRWLRTGKLRGHKVGTMWRISEDDLQAFLNRPRRIGKRGG